MRHVLSVLIFCAFFSLFGAGMYYGFVINSLTLAVSGVFALLATLAISFFFPLSPSLFLKGEGVKLVHWFLGTQISNHAHAGSRVKPGTTNRTHTHTHTHTYLSCALFILGMASNVLFVVLALQNPITEAVRSPWLAFSPWLIALPVFAFVCTLFLSRASKSLTALLAASTIFVASSIVAILFPLGFGFDPFLHRASMAHIAEFGTITPKPLYYIGAYILELGPHLLLRLPLFWIDIFLAPFGLAILTWLALRSTHALHPSFIALLPLGAFISTTPQAVGFLWMFALVIALWNALPLPYLALFALAALVAHPIAGIPALLIVALAWAWKQKRTIRSDVPIRPFLLFALSVLGICALPGIFFIQQLSSGMSVGFSWNALIHLSRIPDIGFFVLHGNPVLDTLMLFGGNLFFITVGLAIVGWISQKRRARIQEDDQLTIRTSVLTLGACITFVNFLILGLGFDFPFLIAYERTDFALRLITVTWILLIFPAHEGMRAMARALFAHADGAFKKSAAGYSVPTYFAIILAILFAGNIYTAYPRHDGYSRSAAFNATAADKEIVHAIANDAGNEPYAVLANQTMSAVAIQELGFFHYFPGDIFAYPVPTGGPLYTLFLDMIEKTPSENTIESVRQLTGASRVYFVVHEYWWEAGARIAETKNIADAWFTSADNSMTVFVFTKTSPGGVQ